MAREKRHGHATCFAGVFRVHRSLYWVYPDRCVQYSQLDCQELGQGKPFPAEGMYCCSPTKLGSRSQDYYPGRHKPRYLWTYQWSLHHVSYHRIDLTEEQVVASHFNGDKFLARCNTVIQLPLNNCLSVASYLNNPGTVMLGARRLKTRPCYIERKRKEGTHK